VIQELVAPDVRALKALVVAPQKEMDQQFDARDQRAQDQRAEAQGAGPQGGGAELESGCAVSGIDGEI